MNFTDTGENNDGEDRLRFYLNDSNNNDSKPDSIALTVKDGQQRIVIDASNIKTIELSQKTGHFKFTIDGTYKVRVIRIVLFVEIESIIRMIGSNSTNLIYMTSDRKVGKCQFCRVR